MTVVRSTTELARGADHAAVRDWYDGRLYDLAGYAAIDAATPPAPRVVDGVVVWEASVAWTATTETEGGA